MSFNSCLNPLHTTSPFVSQVTKLSSVITCYDPSMKWFTTLPRLCQSFVERNAKISLFVLREMWKMLLCFPDMSFCTNMAQNLWQPGSYNLMPNNKILEIWGNISDRFKIVIWLFSRIFSQIFFTSSALTKIDLHFALPHVLCIQELSKMRDVDKNCSQSYI